MTVNADVLANHPDIVAGFLKLVVAAGDWAGTHPDETAHYVAGETASSIDWVRAAYGNQLHRHLGVNLDDESVAALDDFKTFLHDHGFLEADFDVADWIDPRPLADVLRPSLQKRAWPFPPTVPDHHETHALPRRAAAAAHAVRRAAVRRGIARRTGRACGRRAKVVRIAVVAYSSGGKTQYAARRR